MGFALFIFLTGQPRKQYETRINSTVVDAIPAAEPMASLQREYDNTMLPTVIEHPEISDSTEPPETREDQNNFSASIFLEDSTTNAKSPSKAQHCRQEAEELIVTNIPWISTKLPSAVPIPPDTEAEDNENASKGVVEESVKCFIMARTAGSRFFRENPPQELPVFDTDGKV
jgi:hypothetical protein